ncbi:MAG TPA: tripartite tricarboxylate transporter substrate-binding protein [Xanthobacteraceae bacterium]
MGIARRDLLVGAALAPLALSSFRAGAQELYPSSREIRVVCGYAPGTGADILVRYFVEQLRKRSGKTFIVENKVGAGTTIAAEYVARAKPDGYTLFINPGNGMAGNPYLYKSLPHNVLDDFAHVTTLVKLPFLLAVSPQSPARSVKELLALLKEKGDKASYGYPNNISLAAGELLKERTGLKIVAVPYKSTPEALNDMKAGLIDFLWSDATFGLGQGRNGNLRILAVTTSTRSGLDPAVPTLQESGVPNFHLEAWWGAWFPAKTPRPFVDQMSAWLNQVLNSAETKEFFQSRAIADPFPGTPESLHAYLKQDIPRWAEVFKLAKVAPQ